jgi:rifampicin phosphotransferase
MADEIATRIRHRGPSTEIGGKAAALAVAEAAGFNVPPWFVVRAPSIGEEGLSTPLIDAIRREVSTLAPNGEVLAVRSSAVDEDGALHSFAGQFDTFLYVAPADVPERITDVWRAAASERVVEYRRQHGITGDPTPPAAIVQRMIDPDVAGVAFSADPVSSRRDLTVVSATYGVGSALVSGNVDADSWHVTHTGVVEQRTIAHKPVAQRRGIDGPTDVPVEPSLAAAPSLSDEQLRRIAALAAAAASHFGAPQDIEWALAGDELYLLQSRPITSLAPQHASSGALALWDNSNIVESYGGVTTPLTYAFARYVYEEVYRQFCRIIGVSEARIEGNADALRGMLGLIRGRIYYNLVSWYKTLALLPGYQLNRSFMEQMMGVKEGLPAEVAAQIQPASARAKLADARSAVVTVFGLVRQFRALPASIPRFQSRLSAALATGGDLASAPADALVAHFRHLERELLTRWDAPLVNDFFAMIFFGALGKLVVRWCGDADGTLQNDLVSGSGEIISVEPARRIARMADLLATRPDLIDDFRDGSQSAVNGALRSMPGLQAAFEDYLSTFGDRCLEELKLETVTLSDDPLLLARSIGRLASARRAEAGTAPKAPAPRIDIRGDAQRRALSALRGHPIRAWLFRWVLAQARARVQDRENLRFERTRLFGRVRCIFVELGRRYAHAGALDDPRDIFYLTLDEALGWAGGVTPSGELRGVALARRTEFGRYRDMPAPPDRFETRGLVHNGAWSTGTRSPESTLSAAELSADERGGTGCYPGVVRGIVRVVRDPRQATLEPGEILVAERTDPGWVMLFPAAAALLVERGSLLSHSAIVARELGLPAVVSVPGLTAWLQTGDEVEMDGRRGTIRRLKRAAVIE